jgi:hypothetical protein
MSYLRSWMAEFSSFSSNMTQTPADEGAIRLQWPRNGTMKVCTTSALSPLDGLHELE